MIRLYKAYILPHLEYCSPLLLGIGKAEEKKLEDTNYYILRSILGLSSSVEYDYILRFYVNMGSLSQRRHYQTLILVFKSINSLGPAYINELFKLRLVRYNLRGTGTNLEQPQFNLEWLHKSFFVSAKQIYMLSQTCRDRTVPYCYRTVPYVNT